MSKFKKHHNHIEKIEKDNITKSNIPTKETMFNTKIVLGLLLASVFLNAGLFYSLSSDKKDGEEAQETLSTNFEKYNLISKRIFVEDPNDVIINFVPLRKALKAYAEAQKGTLGIYFEYLPSGISVGVNDREEVKLASLSKVPLAMSVLKKIEKGDMSLTDIIEITKEDLDTNFGDLWKRGEGTKLTVEELLKASLISSDNTAYNVLFRMVSAREVTEVYDNLEIEVASKETEPSISPKSFSSIFRSLYLASYLSREDSNYLLDILTKTVFKDKIPAGVPEGVLVAHKIGVFSRIDSSKKLFSDCGIVYFPKRPYILCVFVSDTDEQAQKHIKYISNMIYKYLEVVKGGGE